MTNETNAIRAGAVAVVIYDSYGMGRMVWNRECGKGNQPSDGSFLYPASVVAALEGEVADRDAVIECKNIDIRERDRALHAATQRADSAERQLQWVKAREEYLRGQVQRVLAVTEEFEGMTGAGYRYMAANIRQALVAPTQPEPAK